MLNIIYAGTPDVAVPPLDYLANSDKVRVVGVLTREDAPVGRKRVLTPSPVAQRAEELGLPVVKANRWNDEAAAAIAELNADAAAVVAYGALLPLPALESLRYGWVNLHFSKLPAWRGAAPVQRALMAGEQENSSPPPSCSRRAWTPAPPSNRNPPSWPPTTPQAPC